MKSILPLAGLLLLAPLASPLLAQSTTAPATKPALDANRDGVVDRAEAAKVPRLAERFDSLDRNKDGRLSADERPQRKGHGKRHDRHGLERLDTDHDGRISRAEFDAGQAARAAMMEKHGKRDGKPQRPPLDFAAIDANRDGYVVRSELSAYHERMRPQREAERTARFNTRFAEADLNRDGKLNRIEVDEKMPKLSERFAWLDENRDGFLSREELQSKHSRR
ncbi:MAG TPA: EF-hand domain-containing protein [Lysobacter sp.]